MKYILFTYSCIYVLHCVGWIEQKESERERRERGGIYKYKFSFDFVLYFFFSVSKFLYIHCSIYNLPL
jgi:hypothetical protein